MIKRCPSTAKVAPPRKVKPTQFVRSCLSCKVSCTLDAKNFEGALQLCTNEVVQLLCRGPGVIPGLHVILREMMDDTVRTRPLNPIEHVPDAVLRVEEVYLNAIVKPIGKCERVLLCANLKVALEQESSMQQGGVVESVAHHESILKRNLAVSNQRAAQVEGGGRTWGHVAWSIYREATSWSTGCRPDGVMLQGCLPLFLPEGENPDYNAQATCSEAAVAVDGHGYGNAARGPLETDGLRRKVSRCSCCRSARSTAG